MQARVRFVPVRRNPLRRSCVLRTRNAGETAICPGPAQPSAGIVRVEDAKCRRDCDLVLSGATLCGDRACRGREMQARLRFGFVRRNPLRRSRVSSARNAGESAVSFCPATLCGDRACRGRETQARARFGFNRGQPSAEIARAGDAKCRRQSECDAVLSRATPCRDRACRTRETQARVRFGFVRRNPLRRSCVSRA